MSEKIFFWIGVVCSVIMIAMLLVATISWINEKLDSFNTQRRIKKSKNEYKECSMILGVKVPTTDKKPYTPIAYIYNRSYGKTPVVTIIGMQFFKKLPLDTPVFILSKDTKYVIPNIERVRDISGLLKKYQNSIASEGWE